MPAKWTNISLIQARACPQQQPPSDIAEIQKFSNSGVKRQMRDRVQYRQSHFKYSHFSPEWQGWHEKVHQTTQLTKTDMKSSQ